MWFGVFLHYSISQQIIAVITMVFAVYVEEIIFRGLLYRAIEKDSVKQAMVISAVTFGAGQIVNLLPALLPMPLSISVRHPSFPITISQSRLKHSGNTEAFYFLSLWQADMSSTCVA